MVCPSSLPDGEPVPRDGALPPTALAGASEQPFGVYVHVPFCASRCGYCDFNTYTLTELGGGPRERYVDAVLAEIALAKRVLGTTVPPAQTVFFGGGTPTMLAPSELGRILEALDAAFGLASSPEVTTEANPESVDLGYLRELRAAGFTRISLGMQSTAPHVLAVLDRRHTPGRAVATAREAREAGFDHVNLDVIYGTPGETASDFDATLRAVVDAGVDHVSAYALTVEEGTRLATRVRRGEIPAPDDDVAADRYLAADEALTEAGFSWYEISNWARSPAARCQHNLIYWRGGNWWGFGPGAHSHVGGVRWWNVKHPATYVRRLDEGETPALGREVLGPDERRLEDVMLRIRLAEGLPLRLLGPAGVLAARSAVDDGLLDSSHFSGGRAVLTRRGRLLADAVVRMLLADQGLAVA